ncbi:MAG: Cd(II)/Pb(II)-responsive transcriptional regulator [Limisphaera sp.]|nr:MAG: Cd(II)/Pb(II)-responsive transcriptional regulator [Limisphaera sp.]
MRIGELARATGTTPDTLRYYERVGLLPAPRRTAAGYRLYDDRALSRVRFIRKARRLGLSLQEIRSVLGQRARGQLPCGLVVRFAERHLEQIERELAGLTAVRNALRQQLSRWRRNRTSDRCVTAEYCSLIEELALDETCPAGRAQVG